MENKVYAIGCYEYDYDKVYDAYKSLLLDNHLLDFVKEGMIIGIKVNLVASRSPEKAVVTHPILVKALCKILIDMKAKVIVGDSPGGLFNEMVLNGSYKKTNMNMVLETGAELNHNFNQEVINTENLKIVKNLDTCEWINKVDAIINFAKMKSHGMMTLSAAVKNMFGVIPGTMKLEYHYKYPNHQDFANMLIDIQEHYKCKLHIIDAIEAMEGNGPTMGTPRKVNLIIAGNNPYNMDIVCCKLMNLDTMQVSTIQEAINRGLSVSNFNEIDLNIDITPFIVEDFEKITHPDTIQFYANKKGFFAKMIGKIAKVALVTRPKVKKKECIGCQKCANICPAKAITMKNKKPKIDKKKCIKCFCCQEFCPVGAMKTHRTAIAKLLTNKKSK